MSLLLAPYNDSMRLGMGFNSYTQTMCIDGAVEVKNENKISTETPSQVVTYSAKFVERLSDIVSSMNISYSSAIKKGTIEVSGNGNSIDENKIKSSDINLVVSVQVINQTTTLRDSAEFMKLEGINPGTAAFNDAFGDCYISGFIEGGDFSSIISMRCLDRSKTNSVVRSIKRMTKTTEPETFTMDSYELTDTLSSSSALKDTETTVSVNWMGGGQIKDPKTGWDVTSVYNAAAAFPAYVAKTPQKTWAILTKYKANRSFSLWSTSLSLKPLEYDAVLSYTAELFNNFMEYKQLVKRVQDTIAEPKQYAEALKPSAIPIHVGTLVAVRSALRNEMNKIVAVVNVLSRNPEILSQENSFDVISKNELVRRIVYDAVSASPDSRIIYDTPKATPASVSTAESEASAAVSSEPASEFQKIDHNDAAVTPANEKPIELATPKPAAKETPAETKPDSPKGAKLDLSALIAPEVWAELLPTRTGPETVDIEDAGAIAAAKTLLPEPPKDDAVGFLSSRSSNSLKVLVAVCGLQDVTQTIQDRIKDDVSLTIPINEIDKLVSSSIYADLGDQFIKTLTFIYQYGDGPLRVCAANYNKDSTDSINVQATSEHTTVTPRPWSKEAWSVVTVVWGGSVFNDENRLKGVEEQIRKDFVANGLRRASINSDTIGSGPGATMTKTSIIFFRSADKAPLRAAVALDEKPCLLTDQPQVATGKVAVREVVKTVGNLISFRDTASARYSCTFEPGGLNVKPSEDPFLKFENGNQFVYQPDGNFVVYNKNGGPLWDIAVSRANAGRSLQFQVDGNFVAYGDLGNMWSTQTYANNPNARLLLSSAPPFVEVFNNNGVRIYKSV